MQEKKVFSKIGLAYVVMILVTFASQYIVYLVSMGWIADHRVLYDHIQLLFSALPMYLIAVPACVWFLYKVPAHEIKKIYWKPGKLCIIYLIAMGLMYTTNLFSVGLMYGVGALRGEPVINDLLLIVEESNPWLLALCTVILAPPIEEFMFRKLLIDRIYPYGEKVCVLVSGILFGLMHGNFYQFFYAFVLGAVFGYIYVKTGRIRYSIIFHMIINFQGSVVSTVILNYMAKSGMMENPMAVYQHFIGMLFVMGYFLLIFFCAIAGIVLFFCSLRHITFEPGEIVIPKGQQFRTIFLNLGMILFFLLSVVQFGMSLF